MCWLDRGNDTEFEETFLIGWLDDLGVLYSVTAVFNLAGVQTVFVMAGCIQGGFESVDCVTIGTISNGVYVDLIAVGGPRGS